ncbi:MAG: hypothetical protein KF908_06825 [Nitrosomonas sp.]|nr:hypothetical protein [Nitrosomonas sp.]MBX3640518.1 hypothetical protein [Nitrosomonas sp.]MCW5607061.1 hypothetical protein [Nitrosomonas sp.]
MEFSSAFWSAVAAVASALTAFLMWRTSLQSYRQSFRPELIISGWSRPQSQEVGVEKICFSIVQNAGPGSALHVHINSILYADDNRPKATMGTIRDSLIPSNQSRSVDGEIRICWKNIEGKPGSKSLSFCIELLCWDTTGVRYDTNYRLLIVELGSNYHLQDEIVRGVMLQSRRIVFHPVWYLKLTNRIKKFKEKLRLH